MNPIPLRAFFTSRVSRPAKGHRLPFFLGALLLAVGLTGAGSDLQAASFDCAKARSPLEKLICSQPELDAADTRMGEAYRKANTTVPLKGFVGVTHRVFLAEYRSCAMAAPNRPLPNAQAVRQCTALADRRTQELEGYTQARFYSQLSSGKAFTQDDLAILISTAQGGLRIRLWGHWMPDAYDPKPFPMGVLCDLEGRLLPATGGMKADFDEDVLLQVSDQRVKINGFMTCTPRNGVGEGDYPRVR